MKERKNLFIILGIILLIIIVAVVIIVFKSDEEEEVIKELKENTYEVVVSINPSVEFTFVESYYECTNSVTKEVSVCSEYGSKVSSYEFLNDDAKMYFADTSFIDLSLNEVLTLMREILLNNGVNVDTFTITTDDDIRYTIDELKEYILNNSTYDNDFEIIISVTDTNSLIIENQDNSSSEDDNTTTTDASTNTDTNTSNSSNDTETNVENTCTTKKFSNKYSYAYETLDTCKSLGDEIFYDYYDNVDDSIDLWNCEEIVDECGTTWYGIYFLKYDSSISDYTKFYI